MTHFAKQTVGVLALLALSAAITVGLFLESAAEPAHLAQQRGAASSALDEQAASSAQLATFVECSDVIVHGRIREVRDIEDTINGRHYAFQLALVEPIEVLKGSAPTVPIEARTLIGGVGSLRTSAVLSFEPSEEVVLFLESLGPPERPYLSVLGRHSGKYVVTSHPTYGRIALNQSAKRAFQANGQVVDAPPTLDALLNAIRELLDEAHR